MLVFFNFPLYIASIFVGTPKSLFYMIVKQKKIQACTGFEPITSAIPIQCSIN